MGVHHEARHPPGLRWDFGEPGLEQRHGGDEAGNVAGQGPDGVEGRRQRPYAVERDPAPRGLQSRRSAARSGDPHRTTRVRAVGDVRLVGHDGDSRAAGGPPRDEARIERVAWRAEPRVHPGDPEGELVEVGAPDDASPGAGAPRPGSGRPTPAGWARSATARQPAVVGRPSMSMRSFTARRIPLPLVSSLVMNVLTAWDATAPPQDCADERS